jgi:hypothetical protein
VTWDGSRNENVPAVSLLLMLIILSVSLTPGPISLSSHQVTKVDRLVGASACSSADV